MLTRTAFRFSPRGSYAACLASDGVAGWHVEHWPLDPARPPSPVPGLAPTGPQSRMLPLDDGGVLLHHANPDQHRIILGRPDRPARLLGTLAALGLQLLPHPAHDALALAITTRSDPSATLWLLRRRDGRPRPVLTVAGLLIGGTWLDPAGRRLAVNRAYQGDLTCVAVDLHSGTVEEIWPDHSSVRLLFAVPHAGLFVVVDDNGRIGWACSPGGRLQWPAELNGPHNPWPLAADVTGEQVAVRVDQGGRSRLLVYERHTDRTVVLPLPAGHLGDAAAWTPTGLRFAFTGPDRRTGVAEIAPSAAQAAGTFRLLADTGAPGMPGLPDTSDLPAHAG
ncbi:hypothetical protein ABZV93_24590 [Actinopolymorpha sp. NPDC004070]|uniref:hypothetical protein n=1 Tax=Actinopolymorpha sp. NPDC004070 TaxID=3154548 RepID=UPI0033AA788F